MSNTKYTYAVARIRALENSLLTDAFIGQLLGCPTVEQAMQLLAERAGAAVPRRKIWRICWRKRRRRHGR